MRGGEIKSLSNQLVVELKKKEAENYFYSVVQNNREVEDATNVWCEESLNTTNNKPKYPCALFDIENNENSESLITELQKKINLEKPTLTPVVKANNNKYYVLRTETAINNETTKIAIKSRADDTTLAALDLQNDWDKNIPQYKTE